MKRKKSLKFMFRKKWLHLLLTALIVASTMTVSTIHANAATVIPVGPHPWGVAVNPVTNKIYVANNNSNNVAVIDGTTNTTTGSAISVGRNPRGVAVNPVTNKIYVTNEVSNNVTVVDGATNTTLNIPAGNNPYGVAVNPVTNKIYVANNGSKNVTVIDGATNATSSISAGMWPKEVAVNPVTNKIYVVNVGSDYVTVIDGVTNATSNIPVWDKCFGVAVNPVTNKIYVTNTNSSKNVTVIDGATNTTSNIPIGDDSWGVAVNPVTNKIYVAKVNSNNVTVIDGATNTTSDIDIGTTNGYVAVNPITNKIYVTSYHRKNVTVIDGAASTTTGAIQGTVTDGTNPVASVNVSLTVNGNVYSAVTGSDGIYCIQNVPVGLNYTLTAVKTGSSGIGSETANVTAGTTTLGVNIILSPYTDLSLGDSIAFGMSAAPGSDYVNLFHNHLLTNPNYSQLDLNNLAVSGDTGSDLLSRLQTSPYITAVSNAKVITLSIGGDNLLSPVIGAVCTAFGVNAVNNPNLITDLATAMANNPNRNAILAGAVNSTVLAQALQDGVIQFRTDLPQIIGRIKTISPQAQIYVLNLYNPFNPQDPLYAVFDPLIRGINEALNVNAISGYKVADVYTKFRTTPGTVNFNLAQLQLDPHPTTLGHAAIYQAILDAESGQIPANYHTVSMGTLTGGSITANPTVATTGTAINLTVAPDPGMRLQAGSLKYNDGTTDHTISGTSFAMPAANVMVSGVFEAMPDTTRRDSSGGGTSGEAFAITGSIAASNGTQLSNVTATVTMDTNGNYTISMNAAQVVMLKQPDGTASSLKDLSKVFFVTEAGLPVTVSSDGTIKMEKLAKGTDNKFNIIYNLANGQTIIIGTIDIKVSASGAVSLTCTLIDPYGVIIDSTTGKPVAGAKVTLYYANTDRNKTNGKASDTIVALPGIDGFKPNNNSNPQSSDASGAYGFMVYPDTDYYIIAKKDGYEDYKSPTIMVDKEIVKWDFKMNKPLIGVNRLAGLSRIDTAVEISKAEYTGKIKNVVLATADNYPDALAGSVLAYKMNAPVLLVGSTDADLQKVIDYMKSNLDASGTVYILGGTGIINSSVEGKIAAAGFSKITRLGGTDKYETSVKIADSLNIYKGIPVVLVNGDNYPDALSISSEAAQMGMPILLVTKDGMSAAVKDEISKIKPSKIYAIGLEGVVSDSVLHEAASIASSTTKRIGGTDRYKTSIEVAKYFGLSAKSVCIATGNDFPDAIAGSVYAANHNAPIILSGSSLSDDTINYLKSLNINGAAIFGGEGAVSKVIEEQLSQLSDK